MAVSSPLDKILQIRTVNPLDFEVFRGKLSALEVASSHDEPSVVLEQLKEIVPMFEAVGSETKLETVTSGVDSLLKR
jgi:hypothetical protein